MENQREKKMENELETVIIMGYIRVLLGLYRHNRKDNGSYYLGLRVQDLGLELYGRLKRKRKTTI